MRQLIELYHVTHKHNFDSVMNIGVSPAYSRGRLNVIWLVDNERLTWALAHLSERDDVPTAHYIVFTVEADAKLLKRTRWAGVYQCTAALTPVDVCTASQMLLRIQIDMEQRKKAVRY